MIHTDVYKRQEFDMEAVKEFNEAAANQQSDELNWESASDNSWKEDEASGMSVYICPVSYTHLDVYKRQGCPGFEPLKAH